MTELVPSYYIWMVFILPFAGALASPLLAGTKKLKDYVAVLFAGLSAVFAGLLILPMLEGEQITVYDSVIPTSVPWIPELHITMGVLSDPYTIIITNVVAWVSFLIMIYSVDYMRDDPGRARYWFFMNLFLGNMQLIVLSDNLLALFIGWEGVGLCSYALIGYHYNDRPEYWVGTPGQRVLGEEQAYSPSHAGMKAFVMTKVGDVAMLIGILILFLYSKTFSFSALASSPQWATALAEAGLLVPVALLIFGGAVGKSAQFPLQEWLPDAMAGPAPVSALIHAATMVKAGVVLVARIGPLFYFALSADPALIRPFFMTVAWVGAFTAFLAATQGMVGFELKKILAYSTVSQVGYMVMAMGIAGLSTNFSLGLSAALFHLISHAIFKACLFMAAGVLIHVTGTKYVNEMGGLKDRMRLTAVVFLIAAASLSGLPPLSGFWSKDAVLASAWDAGQFGLFAVGAVTAGITAFYTFRMVGLVFFGKPSRQLEERESQGHHVHEAGPLAWVPYAILGAATVVIGLLSPLVDIQGVIQGAAAVYLQGLFPNVASLQFPPPAAAFNLASSAIGLAFVLVGLGAASVIYLARRVEPGRLVGESGVMHGLHRFLENRWYINAIYYRVFVDPTLSACRFLLENFELNGLEKVNTGAAALGAYLSRLGGRFDSGVVAALADGVAIDGESLSRALRKVQSGVLEQYALVFSIGAAVLLLLLVVSMGAWA